MSLTGPEREEFKNALLSAYPDEEALGMMLDYKLSMNLDAIAGRGNLEKVIFHLMRKAEAEDWTDLLIEAAHEGSPHNKELQAFYQKYKQHQEEQSKATTKPVESYQHAEDPHLHGEFLSSETTESPQLNTEPPHEQPSSESTYTQTTLSNGFIEKALEHIAKAQKCVEDASIPFSGKGNILGKNYTEAIELLNSMKDQLQDLRFLVDTEQSLPDEIASHHPDIIFTIYSMIEHADNLISYIRGTKPRREELTVGFTKLLENLRQLNLCIKGKESHNIN